MAKIIEFQVPRCIDDLLTIDASKEGKSAKVRDWERRYPKSVQKEAFYVLDIRKPFASPSLYRRAIAWLNRKKINF